MDKRFLKGIFARTLKRRGDGGGGVGRPGSAAYHAYLRHNAVAVWSNDRRGDEFGLSWSGPFDSAGTARQASALDVLNTQVSAG